MKILINKFYKIYLLSKPHIFYLYINTKYKFNNVSDKSNRYSLNFR